MNKLHTIFRVLTVTAVACSGGLHALDKHSFSNAANNAPAFRVMAAGVVNNTFNSPAATTATHVVLKAAHEHTKKGTKKDDLTILQDAALYAFINYGTRRVSASASNNGYDATALIAHAYNVVMPNGWVKDSIAELAQESTPFVKEFAYDFVTESAISIGKSGLGGAINSSTSTNS